MKTMIGSAAAALILAATSASAAQAGSWTTHWTGPRGGVYDGGGNCAGGHCESSGTFTGPAGGVWHHNGTAQQTGPGQWSGQHSLTGPGGGHWQNAWTWNRGG